MLIHKEQRDTPLPLIKRSFLGIMPIDVQMHYAHTLFDGDITKLRKLGASIDKSIGMDAALLTCKAYVNRFGNPRNEHIDPIEELCNVVELFCQGRDH